VVIVTAALISIKARVIAATSLSAVELDIRDLRSVPDVGSIIDDQESHPLILSFIGRIVANKGFRNSRARTKGCGISTIIKVIFRIYLGYYGDGGSKIY